MIVISGQLFLASTFSKRNGRMYVIEGKKNWNELQIIAYGNLRLES